MSEKSKAPGKVRAIAIEFARADKTGIYLPYKQAKIVEGEAVIFGTFYTRAVVVSTEQVSLEIRDGVADVTATVEGGKLTLHSLSNNEKKEASHSPDISANATYIVDEENDLVYYGAIGTEPEKLEAQVNSWKRLLPIGKAPTRN